MRLRLVALAIFAPGCLPVTADPPRAPAMIEPAVDGPEQPPPPSHGRVVLDAEGGPAKVSRVTETIHFPRAMSPRSSFGAPIDARKEELLCITPCIVDLRQGAHTLVFTSTADPTRSSVADLVVTSRSTILRHALGKEAQVRPAYVGGAVMSVAGGGLTLMGVLATTIGAVAKEPAPGSTDRGDPRAFMAVGLVVLGVGVVMTTVGLVLMHENRPEQQPGSTVQWSKDARAPSVD